MAVFAVIALPSYPQGTIEASIQEHYSGKYVKVDSGHWLIADNSGTTQSVSEKLGLTGSFGPTSNVAIVYNLAGYFGRAPNHVWEWLAANFGSG